MKYSRHAKILELIEKYHIENQEELAEKLKEHGMDVTQATVSRDIKELWIIKVMSDNGLTGMLLSHPMKAISQQVAQGICRILRKL